MSRRHGGFLLAAHGYLFKHHPLDKTQKRLLRNGTLFGIELVDSVTRLCAMNLLLHGIGSESGSDVPLSGSETIAPWTNGIFANFIAGGTNATLIDKIYHDQPSFFYKVSR